MLRKFFSLLSARAIFINDKYVSDIYKQNDSPLLFLRKKSVHSIGVCCSDSRRTLRFISCSPTIVLNHGEVSTPTFPVKLNGKKLKNVIKHKTEEQRKFIRLGRSVLGQEMPSTIIKKNEFLNL